VSKVLVGELNIHYWRIGEGPDVVMLHGLLGNLAIWHLKTVPMMRDKFRITTYDLRGHGRTDIPPTGYATADHVADLAGLLDVLEMEKVHLVGHSLGADVCLHFALRHPDRVGKMVLLEPAIPALAYLRKDKNWEGWRYWAELLEQYTGIEVPAEKRSDIRYLVRETTKLPIVYGPARGRPRRAEPVLRLLESTTVIEDYEVVDDLTLDNLAKVAHPKLLIYDTDSPYVGTYNILRDVLINCTKVILPPSELRHFSPLEQPDVLMGHIVPFLNSDQPEMSAGSAGEDGGSE
jgi:pimeloyl-ACP methyl ester carboxylesterase